MNDYNETEEATWTGRRAAAELTKAAEPEPEFASGFTLSGGPEREAALFGAIAQAQVELEHAKKASENPAFKRGNQASRYADLAAIMEVVQEAFAPKGLAIIQCPTVRGTEVSVTTIIAHEKGGMISSTISAKAAAPTPHAIGSAVTYLKRYGVAAMTGTVADDDDDGSAASDQQAPPSGQRQASNVRQLPQTKAADPMKTEVDTLRSDLRDAKSVVEAQAIWLRNRKLLESIPETTREWFDNLYRKTFKAEPPTFEKD